MTKSFRVVIVGGGPAGLVAAHSLHLAGIDFVVLERRDSVINDVGASLALGPPSLRVLHQFGLLAQLEAVGAEVQRTKSLTRDGQLFKDTDNINIMKECFGAKPFIFHRAQLIQVLYDGLPKEARDKVLTGKRVLDIASVDKDAVSVSCDDGSVFQGSMVIGADGVHSKTRQMMRKAAMQADPEADCDDEEPFTSTYRCLWSSFARPASSDMGWNIDTQDSSRSVMYLTGRDKAWIFLYERLPEPTNDRATYTAEDISDFAAQFADYHITEKLKVGDVFDATTAGMSNLDEGIVRKWSHGRIVLVGDACHKFTPNAGLGLNSGIQDVVAVCNRITRLVRASPGGIPDTTSLTSIFDDYRVARQSLLQADYSRSAAMTRMHAWANVWYRLVSRYVMASSFVEILLLKYIVPSQLRQALVLDYVPAEEPFSGSVSWLHPMKPNIDDDVIIGTNKCDSSSSMQESLFNS